MSDDGFTAINVSRNSEKKEGQKKQADQAYSLNPSDSPCVAVCSTLYDDFCRGCGRSAMEVANWVFLDEGEKQAVWERITKQGYPRRN